MAIAPPQKLPASHVHVSPVEVDELSVETVLKLHSPEEKVVSSVGELLDDHFDTKEREAEPKAPFVLDEYRNGLNPLGNELCTMLTKSHQRQRAVTYTHKKESSQLKTDLLKLISSERQKAVEIKAEIERRANWTPLDKEGEVSLEELKQARLEHIRLFGKKRARLTMETTLYRAFLTQSYEALSRENPFLSAEEACQIYERMVDYMATISRMDQAEEALLKLQELVEGNVDVRVIDEEVATLLAKERTYNPYEMPILMIYEYATGMILRPEQVNLIKWILKEKDINKRNELLVEFQAGGGKTKVISAILAFYASKQGKLPVFFSLPALHDLTKEDLRESLNQIFNQKLKLLDISLHTKLSIDELRKSLEDLKRWQKDGACLQMVPESWHALKLNYLFALKNEDVVRVAICQKILNFFKENGFFIVDEAHRNAESHWQANIATGRPEALPEDERELFLVCYRALTGNANVPLELADGSKAHEVLQLRENNQALVTAKGRREILSVLADYLLEHHFKISGEQRAEMKSYLCEEDRETPRSIIEREGRGRETELLYLTRGLLTSTLDTVLEMVQLFDYGESIHPDNEVEAPRIQRKATTSDFENPDIAALLSCQGLYQRGLSERQVKKLVVQLFKNHTLTSDSIHFEQLLTRWQKEMGAEETLALVDLQEPSEEVIAQLTKSIGKHHEVVEYYLLNYLLPQVKHFPEKVYSTAVDLLHGGGEVLLFSATLGVAQEYPDRTLPGQEIALKDDRAFQSAVIQRACMEHNREIHWQMPGTPKELFENLWKEKRAHFDDLAGIIDVGGWNRDYSTAEVGEAFLDFAREKKLPFDGAIYIKENLNDPTEKSVMTLILRGENGGPRKHCPLKGSNLMQALKEAGIEKSETLRLFKIYGPSQCTGTDLQLERDARMILTFGETTTLWLLIQAIMRARRFLHLTEKSEWGQKIVWVGSKKLQPKIPNATAGPPAIFAWALGREALRMEKGIMARAFQGIAGVIRHYLDDKYMANKTPAEQIACFNDHPEAFVELLGRDLRALYAHRGEERDTRQLLSDFADSFRKKANISDDEWEKNSTGREKESAIIEQTVKLIKKTRTRRGNPSKEIGAQEQVSVEHSKSQQKRVTIFYNGLVARQQLNYPRTSHTLFSKDFASRDTGFLTPANQIFLQEHDYFSVDLFFMPNAIATVAGEDSLQLKKLSYFLLIWDTEMKKFCAYVISNTDAVRYQQQLIDGKCSRVQVALMSSSGLVTQNGKRGLGFDRKNLKVIRKSPWMKKILSDLAIINGRVYEVDLFKKQLAFWMQKHGKEAVNSLWQEIQKAQLTPEGMHFEVITGLLKGELKLSKEDQAQIEEAYSAPELDILEHPEEEEDFELTPAIVKPAGIQAELIALTDRPKSVVLIVRISGAILFVVGSALATCFVLYSPFGHVVFYIQTASISVAALAAVSSGGSGLVLFAVGSYYRWKEHKRERKIP